MTDTRHRRTRVLPCRAQICTALWILLLASSLVVAGVSLQREPLWTPSLRWVAVQGEVIRSELITHHGEGGVEYQPSVTYRYHDGETSRTSTNVSRNRIRFAHRDEARDWLAGYDVGQRVTVYFRETLGHSAVLDRGYTRRWLIFLASAVGTLVGALGLRYQWSRNALAYLDGKPRPPVGRRTRRPIRAAGPGEVHPGSGYHESAGKRLRPTQGYREFPRNP